MFGQSCRGLCLGVKPALLRSVNSLFALPRCTHKTPGNRIVGVNSAPSLSFLKSVCGGERDSFLVFHVLEQGWFYLPEGSHGYVCGGGERAVLLDSVMSQMVSVQTQDTCLSSNSIFPSTVSFATIPTQWSALFCLLFLFFIKPPNENETQPQTELTPQVAEEF